MSANWCVSQPEPARKASFDPVVAPGIRVLILGSLPGERSLVEARYYAHPRNRFWHLAGHAINADLVGLTYADRLAALLAHRIGLWDTVASATRAGSLDSAIRDAQANPLADLVASLPDLRAVAFNGAKAAAIGRRVLAGCDCERLALPSSSPAYAALPLADKERAWAGLRQFLG